MALTNVINFNPTGIEKLLNEESAGAAGVVPINRAKALANNAGLAVSSLKTTPFVGYILNNFLLSNLTVGTLGWANTKSADYYGNLLRRFTNKANFSKLVRNRVGKELVDEDELGRELHTLIYSQRSPLSQAAEIIRKGSSEMPELVEKYNNIATWFPAGVEIPTPRVTGIKNLLKFSDVFIAVSLGEAIEKGRTTVGDILSILAKSKARKITTTAQGEKSTDAIEKAIKIVESYGDKIFSSGYARLIDFVPPGSHLAYQFSNGALHHGIYLGSNIILEVMNMAERNSSRITQTFITINHLNDFVKRARNESSEVFIYTYENSYPLEVLKARALWSIGRFPNYNIASENCETFANWVFENSFETTACIIVKSSRIANSSSRAAILASLVPETEPVGEAIAAVAAAAGALGGAGIGGRRKKSRKHRHFRKQTRKLN